MPNLKGAAFLLCAILIAAMGAARGQVVAPPTNSRLVIDNVVPIRPARVLMNMERDSSSGRLPTGLYYMELLLSHYRGTNVPLEMVALLHDKGAHLALDDAAYDRFMHTRTGNPYKRTIAELQKAGIAFELCAYSAYNNGWINADLLPGVKVDNDALLRLIDLTEQGYVQIAP